MRYTILLTLCLLAVSCGQRVKPDDQGSSVTETPSAKSTTAGKSAPVESASRPATEKGATTKTPPVVTATGATESKEIATSYFKALTSGDVKTANQLSTAPYSLDRGKILETKAQVQMVHREIIEGKGKRKIPAFTVAKTTLAPPLDEKIFGKYEAYRFMIGDEGLDIYVSTGVEPAVIGFSD